MTDAWRNRQVQDQDLLTKTFNSFETRIQNAMNDHLIEMQDEAYRLGYERGMKDAQREDSGS